VQPDRPPPPLRGFLPVPAVETDPDAVLVDGFALLPLGSDARAWRLHPTARAGVGIDGNPQYASDGGDADAYVRLGLGLDLRLEPADGWLAALDGMVTADRYRDTPDRDRWGGDATGRLARTRVDGWQAVELAWRRSAEPRPARPELIERQDLAAGLAAGGEARRSSWRAELGVDELRHLDDLPDFDRRARDRRRLRVAGQWAALGARESLLGAVGEAAEVRRPAGSPTSDHRQAALLGRWRHALGGRSSVDLRLGGEARLHERDSRGDAANDDRVIISPAGIASLYWSWEERSRGELVVSTGLEDGMAAGVNAARRVSVEARQRLRLRDRLDAFGGQWATRRRDLAPGAAGDSEQTTDLYVRAGLDYRLREGLGLRGWASWHRHQADLSPDYTRLVAALELFAVL
jgi:hypothetical protein